MQTKIYVNLPVKDLDRSANPYGHMWGVPFGPGGCTCQLEARDDR